MGKILTEDELAEAVRAERAEGRTIAFANGCFDVLHVGHVRYLADAKAQADRLVVAINDDDSVRGLKGIGRPILGAADRAELVGELESVDYVVLFSDPDVNRLLRLLKPDVHCKGTDYTPETVPERDTVLAYGGRIAIVGDPKDHSTRDLLSRISPQRARLIRLDALALGASPPYRVGQSASQQEQSRGSGTSVVSRPHGGFGQVSGVPRPYRLACERPPPCCGAFAQRPAVSPSGSRNTAHFGSTGPPPTTKPMRSSSNMPHSGRTDRETSRDCVDAGHREERIQR